MRNLATPDLPTGFWVPAGPVTGQCFSVPAPAGRQTLLQVNGLEDVKTSSPGLGLHVIDVNVTSGDLVALLAAQSRAWVAAH